MMKMTNEQLVLSVKSAFCDLENDGWTDLLTTGGMAEFDLQTGHVTLWPGRKMEVHPHPKVVLSCGKQPIAKLLQLWVAPIISESGDFRSQWSREHIYEMVDKMVLDIRAKEQVLPEMVKLTQVPAGYVFLMPQAAYEEYLRLGGHPGSARPVVVVPGMGRH